MNEEVKGLISELKDFIASKFASPVKVDDVAAPVAEVKILDDEEVQNKLANIQTVVDAKDTEIADLKAEIAKLTATATETPAADPSVDEPKKNEWQTVGEGILNSLPKIFK